jgi:hypothetical protein
MKKPAKIAETSYIIQVPFGAPMHLVIDVDLIEQWQEQVDEMNKAKTYRPIVFRDSEGVVVAAFSPAGLNGIIRGADANVVAAGKAIASNAPKGPKDGW